MSHPSRIMNILINLVAIVMMPQAALAAGAPITSWFAHNGNGTELKHSCAGETTKFSKRLLLQFKAPVLTTWSSDSLKEAMISGYNDLSFSSCDQPFFRTLTEASIIESDTLGDLHQNNQGTSFLILQVEGYCKNCTKDLPLFDIPSPIPPFASATGSSSVNSTLPQGTSYAAAATASPQTSTAMLRGGNEKTKQYCVCPAAVANHSFPELTIPNVIPRLNKHLRFNHTLAVTPIQVSTIMEIQEISCNTTVRQFTSFAYINVDLVNNKPPSRKEIQALEKSFATTYNRLSFGSCDPYFRTVVDAKLELRIDTDVYPNRNRYLGSFTSFSWNITNYTTTNATVTEDPRRTRENGNAVFSIQGECRNCPVTSAGSFTLFDDAIVDRRRVRRRGRRTLGKHTNTLESFLSSLDKMEVLQRHLQASGNAGTCLCPFKESAPSSSSSSSSDHDDDDDEEDDDIAANADAATAPSDDATSADASSADPNGPYKPRPSPSSDLTQDNFLASYNVELKQLNEDGSLEAVGSANELEEGQKVECGANRRSFWSEVFTNLKVNLQTITMHEVERLEWKFLESYNQVGFRTCDGHFRKIEKVELQIAPLYKNGNRRRVRRLRDLVADGTSGANKANNTGHISHTNSTYGNATASSGPEEARVEIVPTLFAVTGQCRDCAISNTGTFNLFDDAFRRRKLQSIELGDVLPSGWPVNAPGLELNQSADACACLAGEEPTLEQGPTAEVFEKVLTEEVLQLAQEGKIDSVEGEVGSIMEGAQVNCNGEVQTFTSYVYADLGIEASQVTDRAKTRMEKTFLETYNDISFRACDQFFRVVTEVGFAISDELGLDGGHRRPSLPTNETASNDYKNETHFPVASKAYFVVAGRCRNCAVSASGSFSLFDDAFRRRSLHEKRFSRNDPSFLLSRGRRMQEALDVCLCPQGKAPGEDLPPSPEEFLVDFNANVIKAQEEEEKEEDGEEVTTGEIETEISASAPAVVPVIVIQEVANPKNVIDPSVFNLLNETSSSAPESLTSVPAGKPTPHATSLPTSIPTNLANVTSSSGPESMTPSGKLITSIPSSSPTNQTKGQPTLTPTSSPTRKPTHRPTSAPSKRPTPRPTVKPIPNDTPSPMAKPSSAGTSKPTPEPSQSPSRGPTFPPSASANSPPTPTPKPTLDPTRNSRSVPSISPSVAPTDQPSQFRTTSPTTAVCNQTFQETDESLTMTMSGNNIDLVDSTYLIDTFVSASTQMVGLTGCVPTMSNVTVQIQSAGRLRRRLQQTLVAVFKVVAREVNQGDIHQSWYQEPFQNALNGIVVQDGFTLVGTGSLSPTLSPSATPSHLPSLTRSLHPSHSPSEIPSLVRSTLPSDTPGQQPSSPPSLAESSNLSMSGAPSNMPSSPPPSSGLPSVSPITHPSASQQPTSTPSTTPSLQSDLLSTNPNVQPSDAPSWQPSDHPSSLPSTLPSFLPETHPSNAPSYDVPSGVPSHTPSGTPSTTPSLPPSSCPSQQTLSAPSTLPSTQPSRNPSNLPSSPPSVAPSWVPSNGPSSAPSQIQPPSSSPSVQPSNLPSARPGSIPYSPPTQTPPTPTPPPTPCPTSPPTRSPSPSHRPSVNPSASPSNVASTNPSYIPSSPLPSSSPSAQPSNLPSPGPSSTPILSAAPSWMPSSAPSQLPSFILGKNPSHAPSAQPSRHPSDISSTSPSSIRSGSPSISPSGIASSAPSQSPSFILSKNPSHVPSAQPSNLPRSGPSSTPSQSAAPSWMPSSVHSQSPSFIPSTSPSQAHSALPSRHPTDIADVPSESPSLSAKPSSTPSSAPSISAQPSSVPSASTSLQPSSLPSAEPSAIPSLSAQPSGTPSNAPSISACPSHRPSSMPSNIPSRLPSETPSLLPSSSPSCVPSRLPSELPSSSPSNAPSRLPSATPSAGPSTSPSDRPSSMPSSSPSNAPSRLPSAIPSAVPSTSPSDRPSSLPSSPPSDVPSTSPSAIPSSLPSPVPSMSVSPTAMISDKTELQTAINNWISSGGTDTTHGPTINDWDVSRVSDFSGLFNGKSTFNDDISGWQTSQVTNMDKMFYGASAFNSRLNSWDVSAATRMFDMFFGTNFNLDLSGWDVSRVENFQGMFHSSPFNQDISMWDVGSATRMVAMFSGASLFDQNLSDWDVSGVNNFEGMFYQAGNFNQDLSSWDVSAATRMLDMFLGTSSFNQPLNGWDVSRVETFQGMFFNSVFNQDVGTWDVRSATSLAWMFRDASSFNQNLVGWDVSNVVDLQSMFNGALAFNQDLCAWGTHLFGGSANVASMFVSSGCPSASDPSLGASPVSPLCHVC